MICLQWPLRWILPGYLLYPWENSLVPRQSILSEKFQILAPYLRQLLPGLKFASLSSIVAPMWMQTLVVALLSQCFGCFPSKDNNLINNRWNFLLGVLISLLPPLHHQFNWYTNTGKQLILFLQFILLQQCLDLCLHILTWDYYFSRSIN